MEIDKNHTILSSDSTVLESKETFKEWLKSREARNAVIILKFYADWCKPCKRIKNIVYDRFMEYPDDIFLVELDFDTQRSIANSMRVRSIPTLVSIVNGEQKDVIVGSDVKNVHALFNNLPS